MKRLLIPILALAITSPASAASVTWRRNYTPKSAYGPNTVVEQVDLHTRSVSGEWQVLDGSEYRVFDDGYVSKPQPSLTAFVSCSAGKIRLDHVDGDSVNYVALAPYFWKLPKWNHVLDDSLYLKTKENHSDPQIREMWRRNGPAHKGFTRLFEIACQSQPPQHTQRAN